MIFSSSFSQLSSLFPSFSAKGIAWLSTYNDMAFILSQAGSLITLESITYWVASLPEAEKWEAIQQETEVKIELDSFEYGDHKTELVFIGVGMDISTLEERTKVLLHNPLHLRVVCLQYRIGVAQ